MIGDHIVLEESHLKTMRQLIGEFVKLKISLDRPISIGIGGESGCGKSTQAEAGRHLLTKQGIKVVTLHMDDYFKLPPYDNHQKRLQDLAHVGLHEIHLDLLEEHISLIINRRAAWLTKPLVHYKANEIRSEVIDISSVDVVIVEGTYTLGLRSLDVRLFMEKDYQDTYESRVLRARDEISSFNEKVLEIEHQIIKKHRALAGYMIHKDNTVSWR